MLLYSDITIPEIIDVVTDETTTYDNGKITCSTSSSGWSHGLYGLKNYRKCHISFKPQQTNCYLMVGLSSSCDSFGYSQINYAWYCQNSGTLTIYESGSSKGDIGTYSANDLLEIDYDGTTINYYHNGVLKRTQSYTGLLYLNISFYNSGTINPINITCEDEPKNLFYGEKQDLTGFNVYYSAGMTKSGDNITCSSENDWNYGAYSRLGFNKCKASIKIPQNNCYFFFGLSETVSYTFNDIKYGFYVQSGGSLDIWNNGKSVYHCGTYNIGDSLEIICDGSETTYIWNGGIVRKEFCSDKEKYLRLAFYNQGSANDVAFTKLNEIEQIPAEDLPSGYTQIEYIESDGSQYFDTGLSAPDGFRAMCDVQIMDLSSYIIGSHNLSSPYGRNGIGFSGDNWEIGAGDNYPHSVRKVWQNGRYFLDVSTIKGKSYLKANGQYIIASTDSTSRSDLPLFIFWNQYSQNVNGAKLKAKLYSMQVYNSTGVLVRNYVPAIRNSDNQAGLFDFANKTFLTPSGCSYISCSKYPSEIEGYEKIEYLQSTGTQYIELDYYFTPSMQVEFEFSIDLSEKNDKYMVAPSTWNDNSNRFAMGCYPDGKWCAAFGGNSTGLTSLTPEGYNDGEKHMWKYISSTKTFTIDTGASLDASEITWGGQTTNLRLFYGYNAPTKGKIYSFKLTTIDGSSKTEHIDAIPVRRNSDGVLGLYDRKNKKFLTNSGSGTFIAGPQKLESAVTDYPVKIFEKIYWMSIYASKDLSGLVSSWGTSVKNFLLSPFIGNDIFVVFDGMVIDKNTPRYIGTTYNDRVTYGSDTKDEGWITFLSHSKTTQIGFSSHNGQNYGTYAINLKNPNIYGNIYFSDIFGNLINTSTTGTTVWGKGYMPEEIFIKDAKYLGAHVGPGASNETCPKIFHISPNVEELSSTAFAVSSSSPKYTDVYFEDRNNRKINIEEGAFKAKTAAVVNIYFYDNDSLLNYPWKTDNSSIKVFNNGVEITEQVATPTIALSEDNIYLTVSNTEYMENITIKFNYGVQKYVETIKLDEPVMTYRINLSELANYDKFVQKNQTLSSSVQARAGASNKLVSAYSSSVSKFEEESE